MLSGLDLTLLLVFVGIEFARTKISFLIRFTLPSDERKWIARGGFFTVIL